MASEWRRAPLLTAPALCSALGDRGDVYSLRVGLVFIYLSITVFTFVLVLTVSSLLPPTGLILACDPHSLGALPLLQEALLVGRPGKDLLSGTWPCQDMTLSQGQGPSAWGPQPRRRQPCPLAAEARPQGLVCCQSDGGALLVTLSSGLRQALTVLLLCR